MYVNVKHRETVLYGLVLWNRSSNLGDDSESDYSPAEAMIGGRYLLIAEAALHSPTALSCSKPEKFPLGLK